MSNNYHYIIGCGGFAKEVAWLIEGIENHEVLGFVDDNSAFWGDEINDLTVFSPQEVIKNKEKASLICAVGIPEVRKKVVEKYKDQGFRFESVFHENVEKSKYIVIGEGSIICAGSILTVNIELGEQVHINLDCTVGHDVKIGNYVTISPGVHVSGNVHIEDGVYIGTGANIINGTPDNPLIIGENTVIAAGSCVTKSTDANSMYAGVPAVRKK